MCEEAKIWTAETGKKAATKNNESGKRGQQCDAKKVMDAGMEEKEDANAQNDEVNEHVVISNTIVERNATEDVYIAKKTQETRKRTKETVAHTCRRRVQHVGERCKERK